MFVLNSLAFGAVVLLIASYGSFVWRRRRLYQLAEKIPGPKGLPFIGIAHKFVNASFTEIFNLLMSISNEYPSLKKCWLGPELLVFADTPESLQIVFNSQKCLDKSPLYDALLLTKGLVVSGGQMWKNHRKIINPTFSLGVLQKLIPVFDEKSKMFVKSIQNLVGGKQVDIYEFVSACSLETLLKGTMDYDLDVLSDPLNNDYLHHCEIGSKVLMSKMLNIFHKITPLYKLTNTYRLEQKHVVQSVFAIANQILYQKKDFANPTKDEPSGEEEDGYKKTSKNFISTLTDPTNKLSKAEIIDEINTFVAAGHETSALVISNTFLMLAIHQAVQEKVVQEMNEVFGSSDVEINYNSLNKLEYLEMVLKEVMRLFPVLPVSARKSSDEIKIGNYIVPSGATIVISAFTVHRNKQYWGDDADLFKPERFGAESFKKVPAYAYIPFAGGPRICVGWRYGMLFMKTVLVNFLRKYKVSTLLSFEELTYEVTLSMKIVQRCMISLKERDSLVLQDIPELLDPKKVLQYQK